MMAQFNPQIQDTNDPNYLGWSKAISDPKPDLSKASIVEGITGVVDTTAKGLDFIFKDAATGEAYDRSRELMDQYTGQLQQSDIRTRIASAAGPGTPTGGIKDVYDAPTDIIPADEVSGAKKQPKELERLPQNLETLDSARSNGKLSETAYAGRMEAMLKDLRARYPGYREFIDKESERVTGINAANKQITSLLGDINSFANQGKELDKAVRTEIINGHHLGIPGMDQIWAKYTSGQLGSPDQAMSKILQVTGPARTLELQLKLRKLQREERQGMDADTLRDTEDEANKAAQGTVYNSFNSLHLTAGSPTVEQSMDILKRANAGEPGYKLSDEQANAIGNNVMTMRANAEKSLNEYFDGVGKNGRSIRSILGATKIEQIKKQHLDNFDLVKDLIYNEKYGRAYSAMNTLRAMGNDDTKTLMTAKDLGETMRLSKTFRTAGLDEATEKLFQGELGKGLQTKMDEFFKNKSMKFVTQPQAADGVVETLNGAIKDLKTKTENARTPQVNMTYDRMIDSIEYIANPKNTDRQAKYNLAKAAFSDGNVGLLTQFDEDQKIRNPNGTVTVKPGRFAVFNRLYSPEMTAAVKDLGGTAWEDYKGISKQLWGRELFGPMLKDFDRLSTSYPGVKIGWSTDAHNFVVKHDFAPSGEAPASPQQRQLIDDKIQRLNVSLGNLANIAKAEGSDVDAFLLKQLEEHGVTVGRLSGIPAQMRANIIKANLDEERKAADFNARHGVTETPRKEQKIPRGSIPTPSPLRPYPSPEAVGRSVLPYNEEDAPSSGNVLSNEQRSSLGAFLSNPAGVVASNRNNAPAASRTPAKGKRQSINLSDQEINGVYYEPEQRYSIGR